MIVSSIAAIATIAAEEVTLNTTHLAAICHRTVTTYHIEDAACIADDGSIRHRPVGTHTTEQRVERWLPDGPVRIGITAGASTPNNKIGETIERIAALREK